MSKIYADLFYSKNGRYFKTLEKIALPLRQSARQMVTFINQLDHPTPIFTTLKHSFAQLESMPIKDIYKIVEAISSHWTKVDFLNSQLAMNVADFIGFMTIQNQLCAELNELMTQAIRIKNWKPLLWDSRPVETRSIFVSLATATTEVLNEQVLEMCSQKLNQLRRRQNNADSALKQGDGDAVGEVSQILHAAQNNAHTAQDNYPFIKSS